MPDGRAALSAIALTLATTVSHAQPLEFADDFSTESLRFTVDRRTDDRSVRSYEVLEDRVVMTAAATSNDDQGQADLDAWGRSDSITARISLDSVDLPVDRDADAKARIAGTFYNEMADGGNIGDVYIQLRLRARGDGSREASICVDRELEDGSEGVLLFENGSANCESFPDFVPEFGTPYTLSVSVDREAGMLTWSVDDMERSVALGQPVFMPARDRRSVQVTQEGTPGEAVASVYSIATDNYAQDFALEAPAIGPYRPFFDLENPGRTLAVVDGRARLEVTSGVDGDERLALPVIGDSDRIEATLELSSESTIAGTSADGEEASVDVSLGGTFYNDTAEGGFNENEGNVFSEVFIGLDEGDPTLRYCMFRSNTADFSDTNALVAVGDDDCAEIGVAAAFDTPYPVAIELDRDAGLMRFTVSETERTHTIATPIYSPESDRRFIRARARAQRGSTVVAYVDDYRTSADAPLVANNGMPDTTADTDSTTSSNGGSGGSSGCSIHGDRSGGLTWLLGLFAAAALVVRRRRGDAL